MAIEGKSMFGFSQCCQLVYVPICIPKIPIWEYFWMALERKMLVYILYAICTIPFWNVIPRKIWQPWFLYEQNSQDRSVNRYKHMDDLYVGM
jgi:hypothetical protein